jgi:DNA polymerase-1
LGPGESPARNSLPVDPSVDPRLGIVRGGAVSEGAEILRDAESVRAFMAAVAPAPFLALDTETSGLDPLKDRVLLVQVGTPERQALIDAQAVPPEVIGETLPEHQIVVLHNAAFDLKMLASLGVSRRVLARARVMDTMLCEQLLRNGRTTELANGRLGLSVLAERYAGMSLDKTVRAGFFDVQSAGDLGEAELRYAERDVEATWKVFAAQLPLLERDGLLKVAAIEGSACWAWAQMELSGFPIDVERWRGLVAAAGEATRDRRRALDEAFAPVAPRDLFGQGSINYDSDQEVLQALRDLGLNVDSTRASVLEATGHAAALALVRYREHHKIVTTYGESFLEHVHAADGRLHGRFKPIGASTGRASSSEPNLQNIPKGSEFRACFRAPEGRRLITADYAAAELRILAEVTREPSFVDAFRAGRDLHSDVARRLFGTEVSKTTRPELRERAKAINFGLVYGMGAGGLAAQLDVSFEEASGLLDRYFETHPRVRAYLDQASRAARARGYAATLSGRRQWFLDLNRRGQDEALLDRIARNMPIQGTNADVTKLAMARVARALAERDLDGRLVNMVHDEIVLEASEADAEAVRDVVVSEMVSAGAEFVRVVPVEVEANVDVVWSH